MEVSFLFRFLIETIICAFSFHSYFHSVSISLSLTLARLFSASKFMEVKVGKVRKLRWWWKLWADLETFPHGIYHEQCALFAPRPAPFEVTDKRLFLSWQRSAGMRRVYGQHSKWADECCGCFHSYWAECRMLWMNECRKLCIIAAWFTSRHVVPIRHSIIM